MPRLNLAHPRGTRTALIQEGSLVAGSVGPALAPEHGPLALVADDEPLIRQLVCLILARQGWRTIEAGDGVAAFGRSIDESIDLLITDYEMPLITGLELARAIHQRTPDLPILLISGLPELATVARDNGYQFLLKPFKPAELTKLVGTLTQQLCR